MRATGCRACNTLASGGRSPWRAVYTGAHPRRGEVRPHIGAATTAALADETGLKVRQPHTVRPAVGLQGNVMAATAVDQDATRAHLPHLAERDLQRTAVSMRRRVAAGRAGHAAIEAIRRLESNYRLLVARNARKLLRVVGLKKGWIRYAISSASPSSLGGDFSHLSLSRIRNRQRLMTHRRRLRR